MAGRSKLVVAAAIVIAGSATLGGLAALSWRSPAHFSNAPAVEPPQPILDAAGYQAVAPNRPVPLVVEAGATNGAVLLFGLHHTRDANDSQLTELRRRWDAFRPTAVLVEGRPGDFLAALSDPLERFGESGLVYGWARDEDLPTWTWEPPLDEELAALRARWPREQVALYYVLRAYFSNLRHGKPADPGAAVEEFIEGRAQHPALDGAIDSVADIDRLWQRDFQGFPDWRDTSDEHGLPGYLEELANDSRAYRDGHFLNVLVTLAERGERVFAVAGWSHAVKLEQALESALEG